MLTWLLCYYSYTPFLTDPSVSKTTVEKQRAATLCRAKPDSGPAWVQDRNWQAVETMCVCVCVADRAGEPAGGVGSSSAGVPQPRCRNPPTALQQDGGQVLIYVLVVKINQLKWIKAVRQTFFNCVWPLHRIKEVSSKPRKEYAPKPRMTLELLPPSESHNGGIHSAKSPGRSPGRV